MIRLRGKNNQGLTHLFLGDPMSNGIDKTVVEGGNAFSPGLWTLGVSLAVKQGELVAPQTHQLPLAFDEDLPVIVSKYKVGNAQIESRLCHLGGAGWQGVDYFKAVIDRKVEAAALIITDIGPAGGPIKNITWNNESRILQVEGGPCFTFETPVQVEVFPADASYDSPCAFVHFQYKLSLRVTHGYEGRAFSGLKMSVGSQELLRVEEGFLQAKEQWKKALPSRIYGPDERIERMWEQTAFHMLNAMECGLPRISVNNYPIFWIRDCVIVLRALDLMGRGDLARIGCDYLTPIIFSGGFGCESDNPGEGLWILAEHALLSQDKDWFKKILPYMQERVTWIERMLEATEPIFRPGDMRTVWAHWWPGSDIVCLAHEGNHIHGRMDGHSPDFYINSWAYGGLNTAAKAAYMAGEEELGDQWSKLAQKLHQAIYEELFPGYGNERDTCVAPYPCGVMNEKQDELHKAFIGWYDENRLTPKGERKPERLWTYFEAAQIHNAILLGERERAWACLDGFLNDERWMSMAIFTEGEWNATEMLPYGTGRYGRGWLQKGALGANMPHNWTSAEVALLLRSMFVVEEEEGLVLFSGIPSSWLFSGARFGAENLPTAFGKVSFEALVDAKGEVKLTFSSANQPPYKLNLPKKGS